MWAGSACPDRIGGTPPQGFGGNNAPTGLRPTNGGGGGNVGGLLNGSSPSAQLVSVLDANAGDYTWVAAAVGSNQASGYQLATGDPVMAIGGFNGTDPSPTLAQFEQYVARRQDPLLHLRRYGRRRWGVRPVERIEHVLGDHHVGHQSLHCAYRRRRDAVRPHVADVHEPRMSTGRTQAHHTRSSIET